MSVPNRTILQDRDGELSSPWQATSPDMKFNNVPPDTICDAVIVGAGITGLTTALMLQEAGLQCVMCEAHNVGFGTTGGTSAHINTMADTSYPEAEKAFGTEGAQLFADAIKEGFDTIRNNITRLGISCDFEEKNGYLYAEDEKQAEELQGIYEACRRFGVPVDFNNSVPTSVHYRKALIFPGQAQFHPIKYLYGLCAAYTGAGGVLLEHTRIVKTEHHDDWHVVHAGSHTLRARHLIYATHIPPGITLFNFRCAPYRSYVLGLTLTDGNYPDGLVYDMQDPYHYVRTQKLGEQEVLLIGGNDHKTGHDDPTKAFAELESYARKYYNVDEIRYRWSSQYFIPSDGLPYIGRMPDAHERTYCATGYNGNGMMLGSVAGRIICDLIISHHSKYASLFEPGRIKPVAGFAEFVKENADAAFQFIASRFSATHLESFRELAKNSGMLAEIDGEKVAVYKDNNGSVHALHPVCTHAKCIVQWNESEKTWDCPCHGARYSIDGTVITGPADHNLPHISFYENP